MVRVRVLLAFVLFCAGTRAQDAGVSPAVLSASSGISTDGTLDLAWSGGPDDVASWELEESVVGGSVPVVMDAGPHRASARSGLADGSYAFRVRAVREDGGRGAWSAPVTVEVRHHPLGLAFGFFGVGAFVFLATAVMVVRGHARAERGED